MIFFGRIFLGWFFLVKVFWVTFFGWKFFGWIFLGEILLGEIFWVNAQKWFQPKMSTKNQFQPKKIGQPKRHPKLFGCCCRMGSWVSVGKGVTRGEREEWKRDGRGGRERRRGKERPWEEDKSLRGKLMIIAYRSPRRLAKCEGKLWFYLIPLFRKYGLTFGDFWCYYLIFHSKPGENRPIQCICLGFA